MTRKIGFDALMDQICVGWGFCGSLQQHRYAHVTDFIPKWGEVTAAEFAEWVLLAEYEFDVPQSHKDKWLPRLSECFVELMGADCVEAHRLRWGSSIAPWVDTTPFRR